MNSFSARMFFASMGTARVLFAGSDILPASAGHAYAMSSLPRKLVVVQWLSTSL